MLRNNKNNDIKVFSIDYNWTYSCFDEFVKQISYKEKKCEDMNKSNTYEYVLQSSICFSYDLKYKITIKVYKKV